MSMLHRTVWLVAVLLAASMSPSAFAQFKWVDENGRVHYGDVPPVGADASTLSAARQQSASNPSAALPPILARLSQRYPVVLYATDDCKPCAMGRELLSSRGIPFTEKRVLGDADVQAFKALGFSEVGFPSLSVGRERMTGFDSLAWKRMIDAAGYPVDSLLPSSYRAPTASALVPAAASAGALDASPIDKDPSRILRARNSSIGPDPTVAVGDAGFRF